MCYYFFIFVTKLMRGPMWGPMAGLATIDAQPHGGSPHTPYVVTGIAIGVLPLGVGLLYRF